MARTTSPRSGFALPMVIITMALLTVALAATLALLGSERRVTDNQRMQQVAFGLAQTGLERRLTKAGAFAVAGDSTRIALSGGYADVIITPVKKGTDTTRWIYVVRSHGVSTRGALAGTPAAERTIAQLATYNYKPMSVLATFTALAGVTKSGGSGALDGRPAVDSCRFTHQDSVAGVAVDSAHPYTGGTAPQGKPPILNLGGPAAAASSVKIDWAGILNGSALTPTVTIPGGSWPSFPAGSYPTILVKVPGTWTLPTDGQGVLIVEHSLDIASHDWKGAVLVGDDFTGKGTRTFDGAVVTGLNAKLGLSPPPSTVTGTIFFRYNACELYYATRNFQTLVVLKNAWADNWPVY
ncbi:MAG: hypothetical protein M3068_01170 [Gemmatimonadota bacterium]|nr:hypothetical protein [Gemmatimonadota bacterium]